MEILGAIGILIAGVGLAIVFSGMAMVIISAKAPAGRTRGLRAYYVGIGLVGLGGAGFLLSRPAEMLPPPLNVLLALVSAAVAIRLLLAALARRADERLRG